MIPAKKLSLYLKLFTAFILLALFLLTFLHFLQPWLHMGFYWKVGDDFGGDMKQHYAAGILFLEQGEASLYNDFHLGKQIHHLFHSPVSGKTWIHTNYLYPPLCAWICGLLASVNYPLWLMLWSLLSAILYAFSFKFSTLVNPHVSRDLFFYTMIFLGFPASLYGFILYQNHILTLSVFTASVFLIHKGMHFSSGFVLGCAFYKPQLLPYLCAPMLLFGHYRFIAGCASSSILWLLIGLAIMGWDSHDSWIMNILEHASGGQSREVATHITWFGLLMSLSPEKFPADPIWGHILSFLALTIFYVSKKYYMRHPIFMPAPLLMFAGIYWLVFSPHVKPYELVLALPFFAWSHSLISAQKKTSPLAILYTWLFIAATLVAISGRFTGLSLAAPLLTCWLVIGFYSTAPKNPLRVP